MVQPPRLIVGNWKMHNTIAQGRTLVEELSSQLRRMESLSRQPVIVVLAPPYTALSSIADIIRGSVYVLGAQNLHWEDSGAFTGEISGLMLQEVGCRYVIVGHSERRGYFGETDMIVQKKMAAALRHGLRPILCVGESWEHRLAEKTEYVLSTQLRAALTGIEKHHAGEIVIAYEPVWAIGSGRPATPAQADAAHRHIRTDIVALWGEEAGEMVPILYGGSVTPENIAALVDIPNVDGALVGGACLDPVRFAKILCVAGAPVPLS
jgi:triosephosphate isomerase (TIM)